MQLSKSMAIFLFLLLSGSSLAEEDSPPKVGGLPTIARVGARMEVKYQIGFFPLTDPLIIKASRQPLRAQRGVKFKVLALKSDWAYVRVTSVPEGANSPGNHRVQDSDTYVVRASEINAATVQFENGVYIGGLYLPFKYRPATQSGNASSQLAPSINFQGTLGFSFNMFEMIWTPLVFGGLTSITLSEEDGTVDTRPGLSFGGGFAAEISGVYQVGVFTGIDKLSGSNPNWAYNGKLWIAFGFGKKFTF